MMMGEIEPGSDWLESRDSDNMFVVGRLKPGVTRAQAESTNHHYGAAGPGISEGGRRPGLRLLTPGLLSLASGTP